MNMRATHGLPKIKIATNAEKKDILLVFASKRKMSVTKDLNGGQTLRQNRGLKVLKKEKMPLLWHYRKTQTTAQIQNMLMQLKENVLVQELKL